MNYNEKSYGKWILSGEHAVLRGGTAIVYPLKSRFIEWSYNSQIPTQDLVFQFKGVHGSELEILILGLIEKAFEKLKISKKEILGQVQIFSSLPLGAGLGASAALCVSVAKWFHHLELLPSERLFSFAKDLEDIFHGESSGVDVAVSLSGGPITFSKDQGPKALQETWQPFFGLTYSGHRGMTKDCVNQVKSFFDSNPKKAQEIDNQMKESVDLCQKALLAKPNPPESLAQLQRGLDMGKKCFQDWGLVDQALENQMNLLLRQGALAVKPTGSGGGGYILSLWAAAPPKDVISCFSI